MFVLRILVLLHIFQLSRLEFLIPEKSMHYTFKELQIQNVSFSPPSSYSQTKKEHQQFFIYDRSSRANTISSVVPSSKDQYELKLSLSKAIASGSSLALEECREIFRWERWNCPESSFSRKNKHLSTREMAFISAITSAGIVYTLTKSCSKGEIMYCGCKTESAPLAAYGKVASTESNWIWGGCSDEISFGENVARNFLRALDGRSQDIQAQVNSHNIAVGISVVRSHIRPECKCHGLSGSCTTKTCWRRVAPFSDIGRTLKQKYNRALRVDWNSAAGPNRNLPQTQMVFLTDSPDYCKLNNTTGWKGTGGRICSRRKGEDVSKSEKRSCRELCRSCGHQVRRRPRVHNWQCNCTFQWCCEVNCKTCTNTVTEHFCDAKPLHYYV